MEKKSEMSAFHTLRLVKRLFICSIVAVLLISGCGKQEEALVAGTVFELGDLPGKRIGVLTGSQADLYATDLELPMGEEEPSIIERYLLLDEAVEDLKSGYLDAVIMDAVLAEEYTAANSWLGTLEEAFVWEEYAICLSPEQTELQAKLNQALALFEEDGTLKEISSRYIRKEVSLEDFETPVLSAEKEGSEEESSVEHSEDGTFAAFMKNASENETLIEKKSEEKPLAEDSQSENPTADRSQAENTSKKDVLHVATTSGYEPYVFYDEAGELTGFDIETARKLAQKLELEIEFQDLDYEELFTSLTEGRCDIAIAGLVPSEDLQEQYLFTDCYTTACQMVLVRQ